MFELLTWDVDGFEKHSFKKNEKFHQSTDTHQQHCVEANPDVLHKIENYIEDRLPQQ
jgi:hypothetical protein